MIELRLIERAEIPYYWLLLESYFERIPEKVTTEVTPDLILQKAGDKRLLLWLILNDGKPCGAAATGIRTCGNETVAFVEAIAGDGMKDWLLPVLSDFEARAKRAGATIIEHEGRRGWERRLPGFKPVRVVMQKVL